MPPYHPLKHKILATGRRLGRPDILFWTLPWLMILIVIGTVVQKEIGLYEAQKTYFSAFIFFWQGIPLPAGYSVLTLMFINLSCKFIFLSEWTKAKIGIHTIHLSMIILLVGGVITAMTLREGFIPLREGQTRSEIMAFAGEPDNRDGMNQLPFDVTLKSFRRDVYPGTNMPSAYESRIVINDGDVEWPAVISMNEPLRYGGYTFYQASTLIDKDGEPISILSVVTNQGWIFPYISGVMLAFGLAYHIYLRTRKKRA